MRIEYEYNLNKEQAYEKINSYLEKLQREYTDKITNFKKSWNSALSEMNFDMNIQGFNINGKVYLSDKKIIFEAKLPLVVRMFGSNIGKILTENLDNLFSQI